MTGYTHLNTAALNALPEADRYAALGEAMDQARNMVGEVAALRDALVADMVAARPGRGAQSEIARTLGVHRNIVGTHVKNHKERTMPKTVTVIAPQSLTEVSREWEPTLHGPSPAAAYQTYVTRDSRGRRLVLEDTTRTPVQPGKGWELVWVPAEGADLDIRNRARRTRADLKGSRTVEAALSEATLYLHAHPAGPPTAPEPTHPDTDTYTTTRWVQVLGEEVTVAWTRTGTTWQTETGGATWTAHVDRTDSRTGRRVWAYGTGPADRAEYEAGPHTEAHEVLSHLAWEIAIRPRVDAHHNA